MRMNNIVKWVQASLTSRMRFEWVLGVPLTSFGERMEMKSSYIWRTCSSTTVLLVSFLSSSQASQNIMFSSLNSVRRNCLKQLHPAALFITFSKDVDQERASSRVGLGLTGQHKDSRHGTFFDLIETQCGVKMSREEGEASTFLHSWWLSRSSAHRQTSARSRPHPEQSNWTDRSTSAWARANEMGSRLDLLPCGQSQMSKNLTFWIVWHYKQLRCSNCEHQPRGSGGLLSKCALHQFQAAGWRLIGSGESRPAGKWGRNN